MSPEYSREWVLKAEADRLAAKRALRDAARLPGQADIACFHAQQCVEKYLKAILALRGRVVARTHDLDSLALGLEGTGLRLAARDLRRLNRYSVEIRYPGAMAALKDARAAIAAMERSVRGCLKVLRRPVGPSK